MSTPFLLEFRSPLCKMVVTASVLSIKRGLSCSNKIHTHTYIHTHHMEICLGNGHTLSLQHPKSASESRSSPLLSPPISLNSCGRKSPLRKRKTLLSPLLKLSQAIIHNAIFIEIVFRPPSAKNINTCDFSLWMAFVPSCPWCVPS